MFTTTFTKQLHLFKNLVSVGFVVVLLLGSGSVSAQPSVVAEVELLSDSQALTMANSPPNPAKILFQEVASGLINPIFITHAGDGSGRIFIVERTGVIRILKNGALLGAPFLNISSSIKSGGEQGLLALAFHPSYSTNGIFFVAYTAPRSGDSTGSNLILQQFTVSSGNPDLANSSSGVILLTISHPTHSNHNGGTLAFGGDGYLYWSTGDGGSGGDPANNAQQLNNLLGKVLRIDVNSGTPYGIPSTNPFYSSVDPNIKKEIWAYGLRNPWRLSFDALTYDLYIGDVGQSAREEVNFQLAGSPGGENYGWRVMEGSLCYNPSSGCNQSGKILPVSEYSHSLGCSITGGYVYRGSSFPSLYGYYFYGDYCSGRFFSLRKDVTLGWQTTQLLDTTYNISTFGEDEEGEIYLADYASGKLYQIGYDEDLIPPSVTSIVRTTPNPINQQSVNFTVTFSEAVMGVDASDFSLTTSGLSGASVSTVSGSGSVYTVTVDTGSGNGTVRLDIVDDDTITDMALNPLAGSGAGNGNFNSGETYSINRNVSANIGGVLKGSYNIPDQTSAFFTYPGFFGGPVRVVNTETQPVVTSLRLLYLNRFGYNTLSELMGVPTAGLLDNYWMPAYLDNAVMDSQIRFTNTSPTLSTDVSVYIGGVLKGTYTLGPNSATRVRYEGFSGGPVQIIGTPGVPILAGMRIIYAGGNSFDEIMAYPTTQLSNEYWFPFYNHNNANLDTEIRIGNTNPTLSSNVDVYIGGILKGSYMLAPNTFQQITYAGFNGGPVHIVGTSGVNLVTSIRLLYLNRFGVYTLSELMGVPTAQLLDDYAMPVYLDDSVMDSQVRFTNTSTTDTTTVNIYLGADLMGTYVMPPSSANRIRFTGVNGGPVRIVGTPGVPILAGMRIIYAGGNSFDEIMAYPTTLLSPEYWFPFYNHNNVNLDTEVRIGVP